MVALACRKNVTSSSSSMKTHQDYSTRARARPKEIKAHLYGGCRGPGARRGSSLFWREMLRPSVWNSRCLYGACRGFGARRGLAFCLQMILPSAWNSFCLQMLFPRASIGSGHSKGLAFCRATPLARGSGIPRLLPCVTRMRLLSRLLVWIW